MSVKQPDIYCTPFHGYQEYKNMLQRLVDHNNVDTTVIDFCATFFDLLAEHGKLETKKPFNRARAKYNRLNDSIKGSEAFNANASK